MSTRHIEKRLEAAIRAVGAFCFAAMSTTAKETSAESDATGGGYFAIRATASPLLAESRRPNIVPMMSDDQGWGETGYNGLLCPSRLG